MSWAWGRMLIGSCKSSGDLSGQFKFICGVSDDVFQVSMMSVSGMIFADPQPVQMPPEKDCSCGSIGRSCSSANKTFPQSWQCQSGKGIPKSADVKYTSSSLNFLSSQRTLLSCAPGTNLFYQLAGADYLCNQEYL